MTKQAGDRDINLMESTPTGTFEIMEDLDENSSVPNINPGSRRSVNNLQKNDRTNLLNRYLGNEEEIQELRNEKLILENQIKELATKVYHIRNRYDITKAKRDRKDPNSQSWIYMQNFLDNYQQTLDSFSSQFKDLYQKLTNVTTKLYSHIPSKELLELKDLFSQNIDSLDSSIEDLESKLPQEKSKIPNYQSNKLSGDQEEIDKYFKENPVKEIKYKKFIEFNKKLVLENEENLKRYKKRQITTKKYHKLKEINKKKINKNKLEFSKYCRMINNELHPKENYPVPVGYIPRLQNIRREFQWDLNIVENIIPRIMQNEESNNTEMYESEELVPVSFNFNRIKRNG